MNSLFIALFLACYAFTSALAATFPVQINPGDYTGAWNIGGPWRSGSAVLNLNQGQHQCFIGAADSITIRVEPDGAVLIYDGVAFVNSSASVVAGGNTIQFLTSPVVIDTKAYGGSWNMLNVSPWLQGVNTLFLVPGLNYKCFVGQADAILFHVQASGDLLVYNGVGFAPSSSSADAVGNALEFRTTPVVIDPQAYRGSWNVLNVSPWLQGVNTLSLVPGLNYKCLVGQADGILFNVQANGDLLVYDGVGFAPSSISALANGASLEFRTVAVMIDPGPYSGRWDLLNVTPHVFGITTVELVPGLQYNIQPFQGSLGFFKFLDDCNFLPAFVQTPTAHFSLSCPPVIPADTVPPEITLHGPSPFTVEFGSIYTEPGANAIDSGEIVPVTISGLINTQSLGIFQLAYTAVDFSGNSATIYRDVHVTDTTAPVITCGANLVLPCSQEPHVPVSYPAAMATDLCDPAPFVTYSHDSGTAFPVGTTEIICTATDASGNQSSCSFTVTREALAFDGFLSPVGGADNTGGSFAQPLRTFKANRTLPIKFNASCDGAAVTTGIHRLQAVKYSNQTTSGTPIDADAQDAATAGNQFRLSGSEWHFNLDLRETGIDIGIWQLIATLSDGSQHNVWIQIK